MEPGFWARLRSAWDTADQRGPSLMGMAKSAYESARLPGDVAQGRYNTQPTQPKGWVQRWESELPPETNNYVVFDDKLIDIKNKYRKGGAAMDNTQLPWQARQAAKNMRSGSGMLKSIVPGRTDKLPMNVPSGSYVIPADIVSGLGQGNSDAGGNVLSKMFQKKMRPITPGKTGAASRLKRGNTPKAGKIRFADGGNVGNPTPIVAAGGEFIIDPEVVLEIGGGDMERGHEILDAFVKRARQKVIKTLQKLPGPAK